MKKLLLLFIFLLTVTLGTAEIVTGKMDSFPNYQFRQYLLPIISQGKTIGATNFEMPQIINQRTEVITPRCRTVSLVLFTGLVTENPNLFKEAISPACRDVITTV